MKKTYSLTIAIPVYNEEGAVGDTIAKAIRAASKLTKDFEILIVDDGSIDHTNTIVEKLAKNNKHIRVVRHAKNKGFTGAIKSCYQNAQKEIVFLAPGDGQVDFQELGAFYKEVQKGSDVVLGYRAKNVMPIYRKLNSFLFHAYCRFMLGLPFHEISTVILWKKRVLDALTITADDKSAMIEPEVVYKAYKKGYKFSQVPFTFLARKSGKAKGSNPLMILRTLTAMVKFWYRFVLSDEKPVSLEIAIRPMDRAALLQLVILCFLGFLIYLPVLQFYFLNDDFSLLYNLHILHTPHAYPYHTIVPFFSGIYDLFGLQPVGYFLYGILFFIFSIIAFFLFFPTSPR